MSFANTYFKRFQTGKALIAEAPAKDIFLSIVIPAYDEVALCKSLQAIRDCAPSKQSVEIIVIINSSENTEEHIKKQNRQSYAEALAFAEKCNSPKLKFFIFNIENLPKKFAGVGLARKIGMDEALRRFNMLDKAEGLIAGFDADALTDKNYLQAIENYFAENPEKNAASIHFEHPTEGSEFSETIYKNIINYELHLRYFVEALRFARFPFAYHTIGSSFVVKADIYAKQGGMNRKKAGEDFYFLQKIIPLGNYGEINASKVIPSPRISHRVPFGTGAAIAKMTENNTNDFGTYNFEVFILLKRFFESVDEFFSVFSYDNIPEPLKSFLVNLHFADDYQKIKANSPNIRVFRKRFFDWFNAFRVIKFLNYAHENFFPKDKVKEAAQKLLRHYHPEKNVSENEKELLLLYRETQRKTYNNI